MATPVPAYPLGAHLVSPRRWCRHHGIYVGDGRVVHYAGFSRSFRRGPIEEVPLAEFAGGAAVRIVDAGASPFEPEVIVRRARSRLGENRYGVLRNNCEHFAEWSVRGTPRSRQVERWLAWPAVVTRAGLDRARGALQAAGDRLAAVLFPIASSAATRG